MRLKQTQIDISALSSARPLRKKHLEMELLKKLGRFAIYAFLGAQVSGPEQVRAGGIRYLRVLYCQGRQWCPRPRSLLQTLKYTINIWPFTGFGFPAILQDSPKFICKPYAYCSLRSLGPVAP